MSRPARTLLLLSFLTFFLGLGRPAIGDADEGFYAEAAREMVESGDWLTPHFNYEYRWQKPILYYWLTAATYVAFGVHEWAARLWSALSGLGLALLTWQASRRLVQHDPSAWLAGAIAATCIGYFVLARAALPDLPLAFCVTLSLWSALEGRWVLAGFAAALGFLVKGPIALVLPAIVLLSIQWRERRSRDAAGADASPPFTIRARDAAIVAGIVAVVGLPWYVAMTLTHGTAYLQSFFIGDNFERFATDRFNEPRPLWFYVPIVIGGMMPWTGYLLTLVRRLPAQLFRRTRRLTRTEWRLVIWAAMPLLFFTLSIGKQPRYILPVLPPLAILLARAIVRRVEQANAGSADARSDLRLATWITAGVYLTLSVLLVRTRPLFITAYPALTLVGVLAIGAAAIWLARIAVTESWTRVPSGMTAAAVVLLLSAQFGALAGMRPEPVEEIARLVQSHRTAGEPVGEYQVFVRNLIFYTRFKHVELFNEDGALDFIKSPTRILLILRLADLERLETMSGLTLRTLGEVQYFNTANVKLRTLLWPMPAEDLQKVLLVTNR